MTPLLIECCRVNPDPDELRRAAALISDWGLFLPAAHRHRVAPLAFSSLNRACPDAIPPEILASLRNSFHQNTRRNLIFARELFRVLDLLRQAGIHAVPFKGPVLAWSIYDAPGLRSMSDLDLFVPERQADATIDVLLSAGFQRSGSEGNRKFFDQNGELPLTGPKGSVAIDLHWRLAPTYCQGLDAASFFSRLKTVRIAENEVPAFCPEDLLAFLCVHGGKHAWTSLVWICDVARLIDSSHLDWDAVMSRAEKNRMSRAIFLGLYVARNLLGADIPSAIWDRVRADRMAGYLASLSLATLRSGRELTTPKALAFQFRLLETFKEKLDLLSICLRPTPADWESLHIPVSLFPVYYLARPVRLVWRRCFRHGAA